MSKNNINLSKRESHKSPNSDVRGLINLAKKQAKLQEQEISEANNKKASQIYWNWMFRIGLGYLVSGFANGFDDQAVSYWVIYLVVLVTFDSFKKEK